MNLTPLSCSIWYGTGNNTHYSVLTVPCSSGWAPLELGEKWGKPNLHNLHPLLLQVQFPPALTPGSNDHLPLLQVQFPPPLTPGSISTPPYSRFNLHPPLLQVQVTTRRLFCAFTPTLTCSHALPQPAAPEWDGPPRSKLCHHTL
jgi:hypothetical protein